MIEQENYMRIALGLAKQGIGSVNPNPLVGAIIVKDNQIIGQGYHTKYGGLHAEREAFKSLKDKVMAKDAHMYVTLEPCCHRGQQPPCTEAIIEHGISKVYIGSDDPNELVAGKGIAMLKEAGIEVFTHVLKEECDVINSVFLYYIKTKMPYVVMKYAMTADGKIADHTGESKWITSEKARRKVHETRNVLSGIMVGIDTVVTDDPMLDCRLDGGRNPIRIVCDSNLKIPLDCKLVRTAKEIPLYIAILEKTKKEQKEKIQALKEMGVCLIDTKEKNKRIDLQDLMRILGSQNIDSILLEGGASLNDSALKEGIVNHVQAYCAPKLLGGSSKYTPIAGEGRLLKDAFILKNPKMEILGEDILIEYDIV